MNKKTIFDHTQGALRVSRAPPRYGETRGVGKLMSVPESIGFLKVFLRFSVRVLESGDKTPSEIKRTLLRLLANIGTDKKCAQMISNNSQLVDRIAIAIGHDDDEIVKVALRTVRALVVNKCGFKVGTVCSYPLACHSSFCRQGAVKFCFT